MGSQKQITPQRKRQQQQQKQQQRTTRSASMIATSDTSNTTPAVWIDGSYDEDATVISEITHDPTVLTSLAAGEESLSNILGSWSSGVPNAVTPERSNGLPKRGDDGSSNAKSGSSGSSTQKAGTTVVKPPSAAALAMAAAAKARSRVVPIVSGGSNKSSPKATNKKAPHPAMDVSPNPQVRKVKPVTRTSSAKSPVPTGAAAGTAPKPPIPKSPPRLSLINNVPASMRKAAPKSAPSSPSTGGGGAGAGAGAGLSELSKQLRVQRAKNEWQHNEIDRLERQLRILSDLKGVSVADLRVSLESACAEEAHAELRNQVLSLQAQLEAVQMQRTNNRRASTANTEATQSKIATLQLRIGELEEVDQAKQHEVHALYQQLQQQTARATTLEATNAQQKAQIAKFEDVAKVYVNDVEQIRAERDALKDQVDELLQQMAGMENQRKLDEAMRQIEAQIEIEQKRKQEYVKNARMQAAQARNGGGMSVGPDMMSMASGSMHSAGSVHSSSVESNPFDMIPCGYAGRSSSHNHVNNRLAPNQLSAIQGVVGRQAGAAAGGVDPFSIATTVRDDTTTTHIVSASANSSVATGPAERIEDDVSHLGDDDMSVQTMDALLMQGLTEEQAKEALAKDAKIASLYDELREHATKASQLQTLCANQKAQIERFAEQLNEKESTLRSTQNQYDFAKSEHDSLYQRFCDIELQLTLEQEKVEGLERQLHARVHESDLRNDQFKCRFQVQNERIQDLEQQQSSLYAAFELLQQEVKAQDSEHNQLKSSLDEADGEIARQLRESEKKDRRSSRRDSSGPERRTSHRASLSGPMDGSMSGVGGMDYPGANPTSPVAVATATPVASQPYASFNQSSTRDMFDTPEPSAQRRPIELNMHLHGYLWKLDKIKGWKKRFFILSGDSGVYQMTYSDSPKERVKGTIADITMGVSTVAETNKSIKKPFSFVLHVDPLNHSGQVLYAACLNAEDFRKWMTALKAATIRPEDSMYMSEPAGLSVEAQMESDMELARRLQGSSRDLGGSGHIHQGQESQMHADHLMAMRMQIRNQPGQAFA